MKKTCVIGFLGTVLDAGGNLKRWQRWRPSVNICQHEDLQIDRFDLIVEPRYGNIGRTVQQDIESLQENCDVQVHFMPFADPWDFEEVYGKLHSFARSYDFDDDYEYLIHITTGTHVAQICLFLLCESRHIPGKLLQTAPPKRGEPPETATYSIIDLDLSQYSALAERFHEERSDGIAVLKQGIQTKNRAYNNMVDQIELVAASSHAPILLAGETGVGKTQLARRIYELKKQRHMIDGAFVEVNCATLRGDQAMSMLFGHVKGAFTGALQQRDGLLKKADNGLLFLDEIGELGLDEQAMLLRAIEEKVYLPVGSDKPILSDFQLIAGSNRNLQDAVRAGQFRDDLLARINLWSYTLPSLRQRPEDMAPNIQYELQCFSQEHERHVRFDPDALKQFERFAKQAAWPGNFRDLSAAMTRMATLATHGRITKQHVTDEIKRSESNWQHTQGSSDNSQDLVQQLLPQQYQDIDPFDYAQLQYVLQVCQNARSCAAAGRQLFAHSRVKKKSANDSDRLAKYLDRFGLSWDSVHKQI